MATDTLPETVARPEREVDPIGAIPLGTPALRAHIDRAGVPTSDARSVAEATGHATPLAIRNHRMMRLLDRIAVRFNEAGVPIMALKGAALCLTIYHRPDERAMADLDLMVRAEDVERAVELLEELGALRGDPLVREDFFPRFHYELELSIGQIYPIKIDLHIRPFRPLRFARLVPTEALWDSATSVKTGRGTILIPSIEEMLLHLLVHAAVHGSTGGKWLKDIDRWVASNSGVIHWRRFAETVEAWRLTWPVRVAINRTESCHGPTFPTDLKSRLRRRRAGRLDRLVLWQAPRDAKHSFAHVVTNVLCTPGIRFKLAYLRAVLIPDRAHMADWYPRRHAGWLPVAHLLRILGPVLSLVPSKWRWHTGIDTRASHIHGIGVFATRGFGPGDCVARYHGKAVQRHGMYVIEQADASGPKRLFELTGKLKYLNHSCNPNARLVKFNLVAVRPIEPGQEITIDYSRGTCECQGREAVRSA